MPSALARIEGPLLEQILAIGGPAAQPYTASGRPLHYLSLARSLGRAFGDADLTEAGFLHGLAPEALALLPGIPRRVLSILEDWQKLRRLTPDESGLAAPAYEGGAEALALCIYDCLELLDPHDWLLHWTRTFHQSASSFASSLPAMGEDDLSFLLRVRRVVAPLARDRGFWEEGNALDNGALYHLEPSVFLSIQEFVLGADRSPWGRARHEAEIRAALQRKGFDKPLRWEWRHLGSIARNLASYRPAEWPRALFRCGFVTITARDDEEAYRVVYRLHGALPHRRSEVADYIGMPSIAGYRGLHTVLLAPDEGSGTLSIAVRILPSSAGLRRFAAVDRERLSELCLPGLGAGGPCVRVFTPTGEQRRLPLGATVLDLAVDIHSDFLILTEHAILNRSDKVGLLHPLSDGDEVQLVRGALPRPLPEGWQEKVAAENRERIALANHRAWRNAMAQEGLRQLKRQVGLPDADDRLVRVLAEMALNGAKENPGGAEPGAVDFWLPAIGLHLGRIRPPAGLVEVAGDERSARLLVEAVREKAEQLVKTYEATEVEIPEALRGGMGRMRWCPECAPGDHDSDLAITSTRHRGVTELVFHRTGAPCAEGGMPLPLRDRLALDQFFVVETNNEIGVAAEILGVFRDHRIEVVEVTGRRLGPHWGVLRLEVDPVDRESIQRVRQSLRSLEVVQSVTTPLDEGSALLEVALPPRQASQRNAFYQPLPFAAGPIAVEDHLFYGREAELTLLFNLFQQARSAEATGGLMAFVHGPLRIGKTSLVRRFKLLLRRRAEHAAVTAYLKPATDQPWTAFRAALVEELAAAAREAARAWGHGEITLDQSGLETLLSSILALPHHPTVVLMVDEVHRLFGNVGNLEEERRELMAFRDLVERTPRLLVLWVGPTHGSRSLGRDLASVLLASQPVPVEPFSEDEAAALLEARKMALHQTVAVERALVRTMHRLTGGEPFFLAHLASLMWMRRSRSHSRVIRFDRALLDSATHSLLERHELFATRIEPRAAQRAQTPAWRVACALAELHAERVHLASGFPVERIAPRTARFGPAMTPAEVSQVLEILQDRGAAVLTGTHPRRWRIAFPLLADYLLLHRQPAT